MIEILAVGLGNETRGPEVISELRRLHVERVIHLEDAVIAVRTEKNVVRIRDGLDIEERGRGGRAWNGLWVALLGAVSTSLDEPWSSRDLGISDDFVAEVSNALGLGQSAVLARVSTYEPALMVNALLDYGVTVARATLAANQEALLQAMLTGYEIATRG